MQKVIIALLLFTIHYSLLTEEAYAFWGKGSQAPARVIKAANQRLEAKVEQLSEANETLNSEKLKLRAELDKINSDRKDILDKLKIITEENSKLKAMILYLQTGILNMDDSRKQMLEKIAELEKELKTAQKKKKK